MAKIITIASHKGGVGKTTTALNLGFSLSRLGGRVVLVDGDPQGSIGVSTNLKKVTSNGLVQLIKGKSRPQEIVMNTRNKSLAIVGTGIAGPDDMILLEDQARQGLLGGTIKALGESADYVIIDSPAGLGAIVTSYFAISQGVLLVINCSILTLKTIPAFLKMLYHCQRNNPQLRLEGIVFTMLHKDNPAEVKMFGEFRQTLPDEIFFKTTIPHDYLFEKAIMKAIPVGLMKDGQKAARAYFNLAMELKEREAQFGTGGDQDEDQGLF